MGDGWWGAFGVKDMAVGHIFLVGHMKHMVGHIFLVGHIEGVVLAWWGAFFGGAHV